ncbi:MAG: hypothetical protein EBU90_01415 [Proteobacteria bacterium]|nr:hypothetical protein [Pseudomonadota bacterium]
MERHQLAKLCYDFSKSETIEELIKKRKLKRGTHVFIEESGKELVYLDKLEFTPEEAEEYYCNKELYLFTDLYGERRFTFYKNLLAFNGSKKILIDYEEFHRDWKVLTLENIPSPEKGKVLLVVDIFNASQIAVYLPVFPERSIKSDPDLPIINSWKLNILGFNIKDINKEKLKNKQLKFKLTNNLYASN